MFIRFKTQPTEMGLHVLPIMRTSLEKTFFKFLSKVQKSLPKHLILLLLAGPCAFTSCGQNSLLNQTKSTPSLSAEWPTLRGNNGRDGRSVSTGEFENYARVSQVIDFATTEAYIELFPGQKNSAIHFDEGKNDPTSGLSAVTNEWKTQLTTSQLENGAYLDLNGDGKFTLVALSQDIKYAKLFEADQQYYRIEAHDGFGTTVNINDDTFVGIRVYKGNSDNLLFERRFAKGDYMQRPHVTVDDMNNDGEKDIVITSWEGIYVYSNKGDSITSLSQTVPGWHRLRKRGFACIKDIDGNGYKDIVIISSLPWHVDVIKNDKGVLKFGWTRIFDGQVETASKISKPILNSVNDFDGDGTYEIFVNVFNFNDDNNWSGILFDATNGDVKAQIRGAYAISAEDLNNDQKFVFFCTQTQGQSVPLSAPLKIVAFSNGHIDDLLHVQNGEWVNPRIPNISPSLTTHDDGISRLAENAVLCADYESNGKKIFFIKIKNADGSSRINSYYMPKNGVISGANLIVHIPSGMYGEIMRERKNRGSASLLLQVKAFSAPAGEIKIIKAGAKNLGRYISHGAKMFIPVVADLNSDGNMEILIGNGVGEMLCFSRRANNVADLIWKVPGRGMMWQYSPSLEYGVAAEDLNHDGYKEVIISGSDEKGAAIYLYDHKGKLIWKTGFPEIQAGEMTSWDGNVAFYGTVQSSERKNRDVVVTVQRGIAHGGKTYCLNGNDGSIIWMLNRLEADKGPGQGRPIDSGAGGYVLSTYDIDKDGSDEVMCGYGNIVFFADSNNGDIKFKAFMRKVFTDKYDFPAYGYESFWIQQITPVPFNAGGKIALACFNTMNSAGTMDTNGVLTWCAEQLDYNNRFWQCMANLDGDERLWVVELSVRASDNKSVLFAYDPINGRSHQSFSIEMPGFAPNLRSGTMPVACDVNGDGKDEIVVSNDTGVYCVGYKNGKISVLWKYVAAGCGPVVVADVDADGFIEVVTATQDGRILVLDK